jgi:hypothetical protein
VWIITAFAELARLRELLDAGVIIRSGTGPSYALTEAGQELASAVRDLGTWGQRWLPRTLLEDQLDVDALVWDIRRRIRADELPATPFVARLDTDLQSSSRSCPRSSDGQRPMPSAPTAGLLVPLGTGSSG